MNKTINDATVHRYYYESRTSLQEHLQAFIDAYNFAKRLKTLHGLTPWEFVVKSRNLHPELFKIEPDLYNMGLNISSVSQRDPQEEPEILGPARKW